MEINIQKDVCNIDEGKKVQMSLDIVINFYPRFDPNKNRSAYSYK